LFGPIEHEQIDADLPAATPVVPSDEYIHAKRTNEEGEPVRSELCQGHRELFRLLNKLPDVEDAGPGETLRLPA
jgi:hypothetical protein